jgi:hypothetical protein
LLSLALVVGFVGVLVLYRRGAGEVLGAVAAAELGVMLGVALGMVMPGGLVLGAVGGVGLALKRLEAIRVNRQEELRATLAEANSAVEVRLALHDRVDRVTGIEGKGARLVSTVPLVVMGLAAVCAVLLGIVTGSAGAGVVGAALAFWPAGVLAERYLSGRELREVTKLLDRMDDPWPGR